MLVCALGADQFAGTAPTRYARRGHVPGLVSLPARDLAGPLGASLAGDEVRARASSGLPPDEPVVLYCGGGISAAFAALGLVRAGYANLRVYDGSLEEWAADPSLPLTTGAPADPRGTARGGQRAGGE